MTRIYVSRDSGALALGADAVAKRFEKEAKERGLDLRAAQVHAETQGSSWTVHRCGLRC